MDLSPSDSRESNRLTFADPSAAWGALWSAGAPRVILWGPAQAGPYGAIEAFKGQLKGDRERARNERWRLA